MRQFEQDGLELGSRVARSLHYQARRWQREASRRTPMRDLDATPEEQLTLHAQVAAFLDAILDAPSAQEWTWLGGTTNPPSGPQEAELWELGRRVAIHPGSQSVLLDDPADDA